MLERWEIAASPTPDDARRHQLLLKADPAAIRSLVVKFGSLCGRPQKERLHPGFNYSLFLHGPTFGAIEQIRSYLQSHAPQSPEYAPTAVAASATHLPAEAGKAAVPVANVAKNEPVISLRSAPPRAPEVDSAGLEAIKAPPAAEQEGAETSEPPGIEIVTPGAPARPSPVKGDGGQPQIHLTVPPTPKDVGSPAAKTAAAASAESPAKAEPATIQVQPSPASDTSLCGMCVPLDPANVFENLSVGPFNRFAHAASMAVVSNPGTMYNPLFLYGAPGSGKTHLLMAISKSIQDATPDEGVLFTTGPRLSRSVRRAVALGKLDELHGRVKKSKALMIDDIHLMAINEKTQKALVAIFEHCFKSAKHVGMTSVYPPRALGALEDALKFQISSGWSVEVKHPTPDAQQSIVQKGLLRVGVPAESGEEKTFLDAFSSGFADYPRWLRRLGAVLDLRRRKNESTAFADVLPTLFAPLSEGAEGLSSEQAKALSDLAGSPPGTPSSKKLAVFFPAGTEEQAKYMVVQFRSIAEKNGFPLEIRQAVFESYDPNQAHGVPFAMADIADRAGAEAILLLGSPPGAGLASREGEFVHAVEHILCDAPLAWIPFARIQDPIAYFRASLDLSPVWTRPA